MKWFVFVCFALAACGDVRQTHRAHISYYAAENTKMPANTDDQIDNAWAFLVFYAPDPICEAPVSLKLLRKNQEQMLVEVHAGPIPCKASKTGRCWGISTVDNFFSEVQLTDDGVIHALPHEFFHHWLFWATGDSDYNHTNPCWNTMESFSFTNKHFGGQP